MRVLLIFENARYGNGISRNIFYNDVANDSRRLYFRSIAKSSGKQTLTQQDAVFLLFFIGAIFIAGGMWYGDKTDKASKRRK